MTPRCAVPPTSVPARMSRIACALACTWMLAAEASAQTTWKFDFGPGPAAEGYTVVTPDMAYSPERGFGFEGAPPQAGSGSAANPLDDFVTSGERFSFSVKVPEGNYRVTARVGDPQGESVNTIKAESRRLMVEKLATPRGEFREVTFIVNVRDDKVAPPPTNAPGNDHVELNNRERRADGSVVLHWDDKLTIEFGNSRPCLSALTIEKDDTVPTIFLAGDSTVTDQSGATTTSWGQMLTNFFQADIAIANHAESGETLKSFITELRLDKLLSQMKAGDYLLIQFGHNDSKRNWPQTYVEPYTTYNAYLLAFAAEAKLRGATPIIISSMERRNGATRDSHGDFPAAAKKAAEDAGVVFIDLHGMSKTLYQALGDDVGLAFNDGTHHSAYGAYELAKCVAAAIREKCPELAKHLKPEFTGFDPSQPDPVAEFPEANTGGGGRGGAGGGGGGRRGGGRRGGAGNPPGEEIRGS